MGRFPRWIFNRTAAAALVAIYASAATAGFLFADRLIFLPPAPSYRDDAAILKLEIPGTPERISARYFPSPGAAFTVLYSHGNGNDLGQIAGVLEDLRSRGFSVLGYDYEGYGTSSGTASERSVYRDVEAAYAYLTDTLGASPRRIIAYGFSLGGAPSLDLAARRPVAGVIVESTFVTAFRVRTRIPLVPFDRFDNLARLRSLRCPILILHSRDDPLIGIWHAHALFEATTGPAELVVFDRGGHGGASVVEPERYGSAIERFARSLSDAPLAGCASESAGCGSEAAPVRDQGA
jgi:pimeloyl-ACP methyl ester carboxylesterase